MPSRYYLRTRGAVARTIRRLKSSLLSVRLAGLEKLDSDGTLESWGASHLFKDEMVSLHFVEL